MWCLCGYTSVYRFDGGAQTGLKRLCFPNHSIHFQMFSILIYTTSHKSLIFRRSTWHLSLLATSSISVAVVWAPPGGRPSPPPTAAVAVAQKVPPVPQSQSLARGVASVAASGGWPPWPNFLGGLEGNIFAGLSPMILRENHGISIWFLRENHGISMVFKGKSWNIYMVSG